MLDNYDRGEVTPPPVSSYGGSPGLLALHSSLYATPTSRTYDIESNIDGNDSSMPIDTQIISVRFLETGPRIFLFPHRTLFDAHLRSELFYSVSRHLRWNKRRTTALRTRRSEFTNEVLQQIIYKTDIPVTHVVEHQGNFWQGKTQGWVGSGSRKYKCVKSEKFRIVFVGLERIRYSHRFSVVILSAFGQSISKRGLIIMKRRRTILGRFLGWSILKYLRYREC